MVRREGHFADGGGANLQNMLTAPEMLRAWTANGAYDCYDEDRLGTLEPGKLADLVVLEANVLEPTPRTFAMSTRPSRSRTAALFTTACDCPR